MAEQNICPGCGWHCDLREPHCGRGEEYRRTGQMPERQQGEGHRHEMQQGEDHRHEMRIAHYQAADTNDKLIMNLRDLGHMMHFLYEGKASQKRILIILNESETITQKNLTERLGIQPGSASEILSKMENAGLIMRTQNEADRRTTDIRLTDAGGKLAKEALEQRQKRHEEMFSSLSEEEKQALLSLLERVCADWRVRYRGEGGPHGRGHHEEHGHRGRHRHHEGHGHHEDHRYHEGHEHYEDHEHHEGHRHHEGHGYHEEHRHHDDLYEDEGN